MTRSLPATIAVPPSVASILAVRMKRLARRRRAIDAPGDDVVGGQGANQHEAFLVGADGGADHLRRNVEKRLVERSDEHHRPLDQPGHLLEQRLVLEQLEAKGERPVAGVGEDDLLAAIGVEDDLARASSFAM